MAESTTNLFDLSFDEIIAMKKKSHTCEEGGGTPQNLFLAFIDELEKQIIIKKTVEVDQ